jgi:hypothetical protein
MNLVILKRKMIKITKEQAIKKMIGAILKRKIINNKQLSIKKKIIKVIQMIMNIKKLR